MAYKSMYKCVLKKYCVDFLFETIMGQSFKSAHISSKIYTRLFAVQHLHHTHTQKQRMHTHIQQKYKPYNSKGSIFFFNYHSYNLLFIII